jgi:hypothetical protein
MKIERIAVRLAHGSGVRRVCEIRVNGLNYSFPFSDLAEFSDGLQDILAETERLVPTNAIRPQGTDREHLKLEGLRVQDSVEHNRNMMSGREALERRAGGEMVAAGAWYMELGINGSDTDCSFDTVGQLFQIVQTVMKREMVAAGKLMLRTPAELVRAH